MGGGGREHAIVRALRRSPRAPELLCAPGQRGHRRRTRACFDVGAEDVDGLVALAADAAGRPRGRRAGGAARRRARRRARGGGPRARSARRAAAAQLEGSKAFAKEIMKEAGVPTASHVVFDSYEQAEAQIDCASYPAVLKADGLAAGKGVIIAARPARRARGAARRSSSTRRFGEAGKRVVLEEHLEGEELSLLALCDGETRRADGPGPGLQADRRRRRGPEHRRHGQLLAGARASGPSEAAEIVARDPPAGRRRASQRAGSPTGACSTPA